MKSFVFFTLLYTLEGIIQGLDVRVLLRMYSGKVHTHCKLLKSKNANEAKEKASPQ